MKVKAGYQFDSMAASCEEAAYFKFQVKSGSSPDCCKIMKVSLADRLSDVIGDIVPDNVKVSRVQCGSFDTPVETPFAVIKEFGLVGRIHANFYHLRTCLPLRFLHCFYRQFCKLRSMSNAFWKLDSLKKSSVD